MAWIIFAIWFLAVSLIPLVLTIIINFKCRKYLFLIPVMGAFLNFMLVIRDIRFHMEPGSFINRLVEYFTEQVSLSFYAFYLPIAILSVLYPVLFYLIKIIIKYYQRSN